MKLDYKLTGDLETPDVFVNVTPLKERMKQEFGKKLQHFDVMRASVSKLRDMPFLFLRTFQGPQETSGKIGKTRTKFYLFYNVICSM